MWTEIGSPSEKFASIYADRLFPNLLRRNKFQMLRDGLIPISAPEADTVEGHIIAGCDDHFFRRVKPGLWLHKMAHLEVSASYGTQEQITDINRALIEYMERLKAKAITAFIAYLKTGRD